MVRDRNETEPNRSESPRVKIPQFPGERLGQVTIFLLLDELVASFLYGHRAAFALFLRLL